MVNRMFTAHTTRWCRRARRSPSGSARQARWLVGRTGDTVARPGALRHPRPVGFLLKCVHPDSPRDHPTWPPLLMEWLPSVIQAGLMDSGGE
jgi:hypothetical protein